MYALNLGENGRVLSATEDQYGADGQPRVETIPDGIISDYRYESGKYIYDPSPISEKPEGITPEGRINSLEEIVIDLYYQMALQELGISVG